MADSDTKPKQAKIPKKEKDEVEEKKVMANGVKREAFSKSVKVKKEEEDEVDEKKLAANGGKREALSKTVKVKKEERTTSETLNDGKDKKKSATVATKKNKKVAQKKLSKDVKDSQKVKKVYDLPGQKHDPPQERDPLRIFYETLYEQLPTSEMAAFWLMERGLLPEDVAKKVYEKKLKKNVQQKVWTPVKAATMKKSVESAVKKSSASKPNKASKTEPKPSKRQKPDTSDSDDDFIVSKIVKKARAC